MPPSCAEPCRHPLPGPGGAGGAVRSKLECEVNLQEKLPPEDGDSEPGSRIHLSEQPALGKLYPQLCKTRERLL